MYVIAKLNQNENTSFCLAEHNSRDIRIRVKVRNDN